MHWPISNRRPGRWYRRLAIGAAAAMVLAVVPACGGTSSTAKSSTAKSKTVVIAMEQASLITLDPNLAYEAAWFIFGDALYQTLVTFKSTEVSQIEPLVAQSWKTSSDGRTYTFQLNPKAKFADGDPVRAADVVFSLEREINLDGPGSFMLANVKSITATSPETAVIQLTTPDFTFLSILTSNSLAIGEAKVIQAHGGTDASDASKVDTAEAWLDDHSVGSGPYVLQSWTRGVQLVMVRNNKYWLPEPAVPEIVFKFVGSASSEQLLVQKGGAAIAIDLSPDQIASLASDTSIGVASVSALEVVYMGWAASGPVAGPLNNPENWDAIKDAINYAQLVELSRGAATQASSLLPKVMEGGLPSSDALKENLTKAKQALTAAGNPNGFAFTLTYATDETAAGLPTSLLAEAIAGDLAAVGITVTLQPELYVDFISAYRAGTLQAIIHSWADDYPGTSDFLPVFIPGGVVATTRQDWPKTASDQQITNLSNEGFATGNAQARASLFSQALELLNQDGPYVPLLDTQAQYAYNKTEVSNVIGNSLWFIDLDQLTTP